MEPIDQDVVKFYHDERDRFRHLADAATLKYQEHVISGIISWGQLADLYSSSAQIGQNLVLIIKAWNRKIQAKFENLKLMKRHAVRRDTDRSGVGDSGVGESITRIPSMDESFEELSSDVFDVANQIERESGVQGELSHDSFVSSPVMFLQSQGIYSR